MRRTTWVKAYGLQRPMCVYKNWNIKSMHFRRWQGELYRDSGPHARLLPIATHASLCWRPKCKIKTLEELTHLYSLENLVIPFSHSYTASLCGIQAPRATKESPSQTYEVTHWCRPWCTALTIIWVDLRWDLEHRGKNQQLPALMAGSMSVRKSLHSGPKRSLTYCWTTLQV